MTSSLHDASHGRQPSLSESRSPKHSPTANTVDASVNPKRRSLAAFEASRLALVDAPAKRLTVAELLASLVLDADDAKPGDSDLLAEMLRGLSAQLDHASAQASAMERDSDEPGWSPTFLRFRRLVEVLIELRRRERAEIRGAA